LHTDTKNESMSKTESLNDGNHEVTSRCEEEGRHCIVTGKLI